MASEHHQVHYQRDHRDQQHPTDMVKSMLPDHGPSSTQVLAVVTLFPVGGFLMLLAGLTLAGTLTGMAVTTPLFVLFSPILIPAVLTIGLAVAGILTSGAFGITALSSLSWIINYMRQMKGGDQGALDYAKRGVRDTAGYIGQKTKDVGQRTQEAAGRA